MIMTPQEASIERRRLITEADKASNELVQFCNPHRGDMGLVSDEIKKSDEYKRLNNAYYTAKARIESFMKLHKGKEYQKAFRAETDEHFKIKRSKQL